MRRTVVHYATQSCISGSKHAPALRFAPCRATGEGDGRCTRLRYSILLLLPIRMCSAMATVQRKRPHRSDSSSQDAYGAGPPTTNALVSGSGFDPYAAVDIYFDITDLALATTNGAGTWLRFPLAECGAGTGCCGSGKHWITAVERYGQKAAQTAFLVRTDWAKYRFEPTSERASTRMRTF